MTGKKAHFIGIAGKGMSATALLLRERGWAITGSDEGFYPPVSDYLKEAHIPFAHGYKKENIPADADIIVIGKNAKLLPESNEEVRAAFESGKKVMSFPEVLGVLTTQTDNIVVAGSYGKSTCTALLTHCLVHADKDPSYFIGEITKGLSAHAHLGHGSMFILEGDEYPSSNWDSRSKFLHYNPKSALLTSATHDHVNVYPTHEAYLETFQALIAALPADGLLVANAGEQYACELAQNYRGKKVLYGMDDRADWYPTNVMYGMPTMFDLMHQKTKIVRLSTQLLGAHNVENIVGASALLLEKGLLTPAEVAAGVASFQGVKRRMELLNPGSLVPVLEGFGSSYEKARSAIEATRLHYPERRLVVVFEPHTFTWRNRAALTQYDTVFEGAAKIYIYEPASQGAASHAQLGQGEIVARVRAAGLDAAPIYEEKNALVLLGAEITKDDCVLLLTSGDLDGLIKSIPALVQGQFPV